LSGLYGANTLYQGSGAQQRNQQRWEAGKKIAREIPGRLGRGVKQIAGAPGRAVGRGAKAVRRLGYELGGGDNIIHPMPNQYTSQEQLVNYHASLPQDHPNYVPRQYMEEQLRQADAGTVGVQSR